MNWDAVGAFAELLGAIAVFGSLVYLAIPIRGSTNQASAQMFQTLAAKPFDKASQSDSKGSAPLWLSCHCNCQWPCV